MNIGNITLPKTAMLAPMAGVTDRAFREICIRKGACYVVGEMASAKGICYGSEKTGELLTVTELEKPMAVQIFGDEPEFVAKACKIAEEFSPLAIDINMGCPAPKVTNNGCGSALMKNLSLAEDIIRAAVGATSLPITVKMRKGWDSSSINAVELAQRAEKAGAKAVAVHGRTRAEMYTPPMDYDIIRQVKRAVSIPVIGNGNVVDIKSAELLYETGCDLIMVGRGAMGAPWVFAQLAAYFEKGVRLKAPEVEERMAILLEQIKNASIYKGERVALREARSHAIWYLKGLKGASVLRRQASQLEHYEDLELLAKSAINAQASGFYN